jgi:uncharacterized protein (DUF1015 family)
MAMVSAFRALRPRPADAARVAAVPYDVVSTEEARALAGDNPLSFLRVSRPELELPPGTDPHSDQVYAQASSNFDRLKRSVLVLEDEPSVYVYRLRAGAHEQTGLAACFSLDEYDRDLIKKHERTRRDKEDDRTRHMLALSAQTGPVFLVYRADGSIETALARATAKDPLFDFTAADGVVHTVWQAGESVRDDLVAAFSPVPALYIADGHHRAASAARARDAIRERLSARGDPTGGVLDYTTFLAVAFPHTEVQILAYNRVVKDLGPLPPARFLEAVHSRFLAKTGKAAPSHKGEIAMYLDHRWYTLEAQASPSESGVIASLDVTVLQRELLDPVLGIKDVRTDTRIDFVGGARGTGELERLVDSGKAAIAFSLYPVGVGDLMAVSDGGVIMPPKSTWFEPKLRDGLLMHMI